MNDKQITIDDSRPLQHVTLEQDAPPDYLTIEGMKGQEYSYGIFIFMIIGVVVFIGVILKFMYGSHGKSKLKRGEKVMFVWIIVGTIAAVILGALQLLEGHLL
ncbi:MAG: hypothetical protein ACE5ET_00365 [Gammaproteobacteria bacterium]